MILSTTELASLVETDLTDLALQVLLDDAEAAIRRRLVDEETATEYVGGDALLWLRGQALSIVQVVEKVLAGEGSYEATTLSSDDYQTRHDGHALERLASGTNPRSTWGEIVLIKAVPRISPSTLRRVQADLVKLAVNYSAMSSESIGDVSQSHPALNMERERILSGLMVRGIA